MDKSSVQKRRGQAPIGQQFTIPTITGTAITSGSDATYTNIPDSDDEDELFEVCIVPPESVDPKPAVAEQSVPRPQITVTPKGNASKRSVIENNILLPSVPEKSVPVSIPPQAIIPMNNVPKTSPAKTKKRSSQNPNDGDQPVRKRASIAKQTAPIEAVDPLSLEEPKENPPETIVKQETSDPPKNPRLGTFMCGFCQFTSDNVTVVKAHHDTEHPKETFAELITRKINDVCIGIAPQNDHKYVFTCKYCSLRNESLVELYEHWQQSHKYVKVSPLAALTASPKKQGLGKKFVFSLDFNVRCAFCSYRISYRQMRSHYLRLHPEGPCASNHPKHRQQCGICGFKADQDALFEHFADEHPLQSADESLTLLDRHIVPINQKMLECLELNGHRGSHKCLYCNVTFDFVEDFEAHHKSEHNGWTELFEVTPAPMFYGCTICDFEAPNELEVVQHLQHHNLYKFQAKFQCLICPALFKNKIDLRRHHTEDHLSDKRGWRLTPISTRMAVYNRIKVLFPNGLYVCKAELAETEYGSMAAIMDELERLEEEELLNELNPSRCVKRKHDETEPETKAPAPPKPGFSKPGPRKMQRAEAPAEFSFYGKPREKVDLKKIYTTMMFGQNDMKISCDRFAMLVNIDPKLILKKVKLPDYL